MINAVIILKFLQNQISGSCQNNYYCFSHCRVIETKHSDFAVGDLVFGNFGWVTRTISDGNPEGHPHGLRKLDPNQPVPPSTAVGILGMTG